MSNPVNSYSGSKSPFLMPFSDRTVRYASGVFVRNAFPHV